MEYDTIFIVEGVTKAMSKELVNITTEAITKDIPKALYADET